MNPTNLAGLIPDDQRLLDVHDRILTALQHRSLSTLIRTGSEIFECPIVLTDERYHRLGMWPQERIGDQVYDYLLGTEALPLDLVSSYTEAYLSGKNAGFEPFYVNEGPVGELPRILAEVRNRQTILGHLGIILGNRAPEPWHLEASRILTRALSVLLSPRIGLSGSSKTNPAYLLYDALDPSSPDNKRDEALSELASRYSDPWKLLLVNTSESTDLEVLAGAVTLDLTGRYPELILIHINDYLVALEHKGSPAQQLTRVAAYLTSIGYTRLLLIPEMQTRSVYKQAIAIGDLILKSEVDSLFSGLREEGVLNYRDVQPWPALIALAKDPAAEAFIHPLLDKLENHDGREGTAYYTTLETYCTTAFNRSQTAKDLHVHRNTLLYRLDRISEGFNIDLEDPATLLYLTISFLLRRVLQSKTTG